MGDLKNNKVLKKYILLFVLIIFLSFSIFAFLVIRFNQNISKTKFTLNLLTPIKQSSKFDLSVINKNVNELAISNTAPSIGPKNAKITVVEFFDFRCHYCHELHPTIRRLTLEYKDKVHFIFRDFPVIGEDSIILGLAGRCANEQGKFFNFHDKVFANNSVPSVDDLSALAGSIGMNVSQFEVCVNSKRYQNDMNKDMEDALALGVSGTPTLFINGHMISGAPPYSILKTIFDTTLINSINN